MYAIVLNKSFTVLSSSDLRSGFSLQSSSTFPYYYVQRSPLFCSSIFSSSIFSFKFESLNSSSPSSISNSVYSSAMPSKLPNSNTIQVFYNYKYKSFASKPIYSLRES